MKQLLKFGAILTIATSGLMFTACEGEDGDPGAKGDKGDQGDAGSKGDKGDKGDNGEGFDEAVQYGNIVVQFTGTRRDGVDFDQTVDYKFAPLGTGSGEGPSLIGSSYGYTDGENYSAFNVGRFLGSVDDYYDQSRIIVNFNRYLSEGNDIVFETNTLELHNAFTTEDYKYFRIDGDFGGYISAENYSDYSYNPETGSLKFKINATIPGEDNQTGNDLIVSITADAKVLQEVDYPK
jgi:hypothetical protein